MTMQCHCSQQKHDKSAPRSHYGLMEYRTLSQAPDQPSARSGPAVVTPIPSMRRLRLREDW